jgi:hypothetical protein
LGPGRYLGPVHHRRASCAQIASRPVSTRRFAGSLGAPDRDGGDFHVHLRGDLEDTFEIANLLLADKHDLIHKAIGWMLRETGDCSRLKIIDFLKHNYSQIPRTTLRYAIEHLPEVQRNKALKGLFA